MATYPQQKIQLRNTLPGQEKDLNPAYKGAMQMLNYPFLGLIGFVIGGDLSMAGVYCNMHWLWSLS